MQKLIEFLFDSCTLLLLVKLWITIHPWLVNENDFLIWNFPFFPKVYSGFSTPRWQIHSIMVNSAQTVQLNTYLLLIYKIIFSWLMVNNSKNLHQKCTFMLLYWTVLLWIFFGLNALTKAHSFCMDDFDHWFLFAFSIFQTWSNVKSSVDT